MKIIYKFEEKYIYDMRGMYFFTKIHIIQLIFGVCHFRSYFASVLSIILHI